MSWIRNAAKAIDYVLAQENDFTDEEIQDGCLYTLRKYGGDYPALGEVIVQTIHQNRFSGWTLFDCLKKQKERAVCHA